MLLYCLRNMRHSLRYSFYLLSKNRCLRAHPIECIVIQQAAGQLERVSQVSSSLVYDVNSVHGNNNAGIEHGYNGKGSAIEMDMRFTKKSGSEHNCTRESLQT